MIKLTETAALLVRQNISHFRQSNLVVPASAEGGALPAKLRKMFESGSLPDFFANVLPVSMLELIQWDSSKAEKGAAVHKVLDFAFLSVQCEIDKFTVFTFHLPAIYKRITRKSELAGSEKISIMMFLLDVACDRMQRGDNIASLLSDGFPLSLAVCDTPQEIRDVTRVMVDKFGSNNNYNLLTEANNLLSYLKSHFDPQGGSNLVKTLIKMGRRQEFKMMNQICDAEFLNSKYDRLREVLFFSSGSLSERELSGICKVLVLIVKLNTTSRHCETVANITQTLLNELERDIDNKTLNRQRIAFYCEALSRIALFKALFAEELEVLKRKTPSDLESIITSKFPSEVIEDSTALTVLNSLAVRLEHMKHQYDQVERAALTSINEFLNVDVPASVLPQDKLAFRVQHLNNYVNNKEKNVAIREYLVSNGYNPGLFDEDPRIAVVVNHKRNVEENLRLGLVGLFGEYVDILKSLHVESIEVSKGLEVSVNDLFSDDLSLEELKRRRTHALRAIDAKKEVFPLDFSKRRLALLSKETQLENDAENHRRMRSDSPGEKSKFYIELNRSFLKCLGTCSPNVVGCYAPDGEHCEKVVEIGLKANSAIIGVYQDAGEDEQGVEIENAEVLFTAQGMYVFKIYSSGHPFDTGAIWVSMFKWLLETNRVPAIILSKSIPSPSIFAFINSFVPTEYNGSVIAYRDDFFDGHKTYYDHKPEKIGSGSIVLTKANVHSIEISATLQDAPFKNPRLASPLPPPSPSRNAYTQIMQHNRRDLVGYVTAQVMQALVTEGILNTQQVDALGKFISQFVQKIIETGEHRDVTMLRLGFEVTRWNSKRKKNRKVPGPKSPATRHDTFAQRHDTFDAAGADEEAVIAKIVAIVRDRVAQLYQVDAVNLFNRNHLHFFELKKHLEVLNERQGDLFSKSKERALLENMKKVLKERQDIVPISSEALSDPDSDTDASVALRAVQEDVMRFIYLNEDKVWRSRGGRPKEESLEQFFNFLPVNNVQGDDGVEGKRFPGVIVLRVEKDEELSDESSQNQISGSWLDQITGYAVGEFRDAETYEIVTAWVDPRYKGVNNGVEMYLCIIKTMDEMGAKFLVCDVLKGRTDRLIRSNFLLQMLHNIGLDRYIVTKREDSYLSITESGNPEQFEKITLKIAPIITAMRLYSKITYVGSLCGINTLGNASINQIFDTKGSKTAANVLAAQRRRRTPRKKKADESRAQKIYYSSESTSSSLVKSSPWWVKTAFAFGVGFVVLKSTMK
eukprot:TRINITY_DN3869_c0_g1_i2.p1 TRINITY_DN3869_c0_g1~~TRINITY_DN3869_c0_g1_i2.p1  ORF type:complete len:1254 (-),score=367.64 TRINITY_DN3869_c0_g1_i2:254-4015(-)